MICLFGSTITLVLATFFIFYCLHDVPKLETKRFYEEKTSRIYDNKGFMIAEIGLLKKEWISYQDIDDTMIMALLSVEDSRFFSHSGIDYQRLLSATIKNFQSMSFKEGASTINQQLIKNTFLTNDKTIKRKVQEIYLAIMLDQKLSKEQILEAYLNSVLFGNRIYGVERASLYFFNHSARVLSISEAALLAGLVQLPNYYNPHENYDECLKRRNLVISLMAEKGFISQEEKENEIQKPIVLETIIVEPKYQSYIDYVVKEAYEMYNINIYSGGYDIYTSMDENLQAQIDDIMNSTKYLDEDLKAGIVAMDNRSGEIEGIGGIKNKVEFGLNYATDVALQTGSSIKPILDYGPAFEYLNYGTGMMILDEEYTYSDGTKLKNWDYQYLGYITIRKALVDSRNIPALKVYQEVGSSLSFQFANQLGIKQKETPYESHALGGFNIGYTVLEMTNAYSTFANMGSFIKAHAITRINETPTFFVSYEAIKPSTAFMINNILHDIIYQSRYDVKGMYLSAKTGQTNYDYQTRIKYQIPSIGTKDSWMIGYSQEKSVGVWCGYDSNEFYLDNNDKNIPRYLFKDIISNYSSYQNSSYKMPSNLCCVLIEKGHSLPYLALTKNYNSSYEYFIKGTEPHAFFDPKGNNIIV